jgi:molybdenum cofactor cytidylyltransferase
MGKWKMLLPVEGSTVIERAVQSALSFCCRVIVVGGFRYAELESLFCSWRKVFIVENRTYSRGMFSSVQAGVAEASARRVFISPGDMPFIKSSTYEKLAEAFSAPAVQPYYRGEPGHPVLIGGDVIGAILAADPETAILEKILRPFRPNRVEVDDPGTVIDLDTPGDARRYLT